MTHPSVPLPVRDPMLEISRGLPTGMAPVLKFGKNDDVDGAEDIWDGGGTWVAPTTARLHAIVSTEAADTSSGTGARSVRVYGLDTNWRLKDEIVILSGTVAKNTVNAYQRIFRMKVVTAGSGRTNAGIITATAATDGTVTAQITIGMSQTLMAIYTVPVNKTAHINCYYASILRTTTATAEITLFTREGVDVSTYVKQVKHVNALSGAGVSYFCNEFRPYFSVPEKSDIILSVSNVSVVNSIISGGFNAILMDY